LLGIHDYPSLWRYREISLMLDAKQSVTSATKVYGKSKKCGPAAWRIGNR
jgi:hypothetical protein